MRLLTLSLLALLIIATPAHASRTVTSPTVTEGETVGEVKGEYVIDDNDNTDGAWKNKVVLGHGFTSFWYSEIETTVEHSGNPDDETDFSAIDWKNKFQFTSQKEAGIDTGARISYSKNLSGGDDRAELKLLAAKDMGPTSHRLNVIFDRSVQSGKGLNWGLSWSSRYKVADEFQPGFELYDSFGRIGDEQGRNTQDHRLGPVFYGKLGSKLSYDAGYLVGLTDRAPDGTVKIILKYKLQ